MFCLVEHSSYIPVKSVSNSNTKIQNKLDPNWITGFCDAENNLRNKKEIVL